MAKTLGSVSGRQPTNDALIGHEHYPKIRRLRTNSDWQRKLSQRTLIGYKNFQKIWATRMGIEKAYGRTDLLTQIITLVATPLRGRQPQKCYTNTHFAPFLFVINKIPCNFYLRIFFFMTVILRDLCEFKLTVFTDKPR